ncbi:MAG: hypothetical protein FWD57_12265 [Polyangiaceae bacterium]|nr:hypothetical protein [Polyangiaceae bacterium]
MATKPNFAAVQVENIELDRPTRKVDPMAATFVSPKEVSGWKVPRASSQRLSEAASSPSVEHSGVQERSSSGIPPLECPSLDGFFDQCGSEFDSLLSSVPWISRPDQQTPVTADSFADPVRDPHSALTIPVAAYINSTRGRFTDGVFIPGTEQDPGELSFEPDSTPAPGRDDLAPFSVSGRSQVLLEHDELGEMDFAEASNFHRNFERHDDNRHVEDIPSDSIEFDLVDPTNSFGPIDSLDVSDSIEPLDSVHSAIQSARGPLIPIQRLPQFDNIAFETDETPGQRRHPNAQATLTSLAHDRKAFLDNLRARCATGDFAGVIEFAESVLAEQPISSADGIENEEAARFRSSCADALILIYTTRIGSLAGIPRRVVSTADVRSLAIDHRAGFVLSCIDGQSTVEEILDVSGMPQLDAVRILYTLIERGIIDV